MKSRQTNSSLKLKIIVLQRENNVCKIRTKQDSPDIVSEELVVFLTYSRTCPESQPVNNA